MADIKYEISVADTYCEQFLIVPELSKNKLLKDY